LENASPEEIAKLTSGKNTREMSNLTRDVFRSQKTQNAMKPQEKQQKLERGPENKSIQNKPNLQSAPKQVSQPIVSAPSGGKSMGLN